jgi:hypothetical protein
MQAYHKFKGKFEKLINLTYKIATHKDIKVIREIDY